jgi:uncharacterized protein
MRNAGKEGVFMLVWIEGTTRRFDGYNYFGEHPEIPIDWFNAHAA